MTLRIAHLLRGSLGILLLLLAGFEARGLAQAVSGQSVDTPLELSEAGSKHISINLGGQLFVSLRRPGGTAYFWAATAEDKEIINVQYVKTSREPRTSDSQIVGAPELDIFAIMPLRSGIGLVRFDLAAARSEPIRSVFVQFDVSASGRR